VRSFDSVPHAELMKSVARRIVDGAMLHLLSPAYHSDSAKGLSPRQRAGFQLRHVTIFYRAQ